MRLILFTLAWLGGILLGHLLWTKGVLGCTTPAWPGGLLAGLLLAGLLPAAVLLRGSSRPKVRLACAWLGPPCLLCLLGAWRYQLQPLALCAGPQDLAYYNGQGRWVTLEGAVDGYPDVRDTVTLYPVAAASLTVDGHTRPVQGRVLAQLPRTPAWRYGDRLSLSGLLEAPPTFDDFDYRAYLARQGIRSVLRRGRGEPLARGQGSPFWAALYGLRLRGSAVLDRSLPEPAAALANGILLGIESGIPPGLNGAFQATGTSHIIVISGSNITLLAGALLAIFGRFMPRRRASWLVILSLGLYVLLVGAGPAATRAGIMGALVVLALVFGRQSTPLVLLAASALAMTAANPLTLWDIGFQLSLLATLGLILFSPPLQAWAARWYEARPAPPLLRKAVLLLADVVIVTVAAQITTLPLMIYYFGRLSLLALLANALILPAQPPILAWGLVALAGGLVWLPLGQILAAVPWLFLTYTVEVVQFLARLPWITIQAGAWGGWLVPFVYLALAAALGLRWLRRSGRSPTVWQRQAAAWTCMLALPIILALASLSGRPDGKLHVYFLPGAGHEAALLLTPGGRSVYVAGQGALEAGNGAAVAAPAGAQDGSKAAAQAGRLPPGAPQPALALTSGLPPAWPAAPAIDPATITPGQILQVEPGVQLERLAVGSAGAWLLRYGEFSLLLPSALGQEAQVALAERPPSVRLTLLKLPEPGSGSWPLPQALEALNPQVVLRPQDATYPPEVTAYLAGRATAPVPPAALLEVVTDGRRFWLRSWSGQAPR